MTLLSYGTEFGPREHPCKTPGPFVRYRDKIGVGARWKCEDCGQVWEFTSGVGGLLESPPLFWDRVRPGQPWDKKDRLVFSDE